ncbi:MAG: hypothetical protein IJ156_04980 [Bacteroidales bacterium]|nr:hypothetical protein [Bacteroidales bacterium]
MAWRRHLPGFKAWNRLCYKREHPALEREVFGIRFPHPVGVAPVLERQADLLDELRSIGFAFTGIIPGETPVEVIANRLLARESDMIAGIELRAEGDDEQLARKTIIRTYSLLYDFADYFVVDINKESGLSSLDDLSDWVDILDELLSLRLCYERYKPILVRFSPSHADEQLERILDFCLLSGIDGVIMPGIRMVRQAAEYAKGRLPVIGSGAVTTQDAAIGLLQAGACLVEVAQGLPLRTYSTAKRLLEAIDNPFQAL